MAQVRPLTHPPIQEATIQFEFGNTELTKAELDQISSVYVAEGWQQKKAHAFQATFAGVGTDSPSVSAAGNFLGFVLTSPGMDDLVHVRAGLVAGSKHSYTSWEALLSLARQAFERYIAVAKPDTVSKISTRFVNRLPSRPQFKSFSDILLRPPLPIDGLPDAVPTDFLRRHIMQKVEGDFVANLTIGTVAREPGEELGGPALVLDSDVSRACNVPPVFDALTDDLGKLRSIKNTLFFNSLTDAVVEEFV